MYWDRAGQHPIHHTLQTPAVRRQAGANLGVVDDLVLNVLLQTLQNVQMYVEVDLADQITHIGLTNGGFALQFLAGLRQRTGGVLILVVIEEGRRRMDIGALVDDVVLGEPTVHNSKTQ